MPSILISAMKVSVRELKNRLSEYLRLVAAGEEVIVTSHKREVARLVPPERAGRIAEESPEYVREVLQKRLQSLPWVRWSGGKPLPRPGIKVKSADKTVAQSLLDDRR